APACDRRDHADTRPGACAHVARALRAAGLRGARAGLRAGPRRLPVSVSRPAPARAGALVLDAPGRAGPAGQPRGGGLSPADASRCPVGLGAGDPRPRAVTRQASLITASVAPAVIGSPSLMGSSAMTPALWAAIS